MVNNILNEKQAAAYIHMSVSYLQHARLCHAYPGMMPGPRHLKIGRSVRYRVDDLKQWLDSKLVV